MNTIDTIYFPATYEDSRAYFRDQLDMIKTIWPSARLENCAVSIEEDLTIDWILAEPIKKNGKLVLITTGLHGVEGFIGAAMLDLFRKEYLPELDPLTTGVLLIHAINPWGMKNYRRFNPNNVDLNRNFMETQEEFDEDFNQSYRMLDEILNPRKPLDPGWKDAPKFVLNVITNLIRYGSKSMREAVLLGQQSNPRGLYFTGREYQPETQCIRELIESVFSIVDELLILDMHTGYGPKDQMSLIVPPNEARSSVKLMKEFRYPLVNKSDPEEFYRMRGDMIEWIYKYRNTVYPDTVLFGAAFEFGTVGSSILHEAISLKTMIRINQADQQGTRSDAVRRTIHEEFVEMYYPSAGKWREKALADCRQAFSGVLSAAGFN